MAWVLKIGGSLYRNPALREIVCRADGLTDKSGTAPLLIPGGGCFADQVRSAQQHWLFPDATAHQMALLAMRQYGRMLAALSKFPVTERIEVPTGKPAVWLASDHLSDDKAWSLPADWTVTSDSVAAWIARRLQASKLILLKSVSLSQTSVDELCDDCFVQAVGDLDYEIFSADEWLSSAFSE